MHHIGTPICLTQVRFLFHRYGKGDFTTEDDLANVRAWKPHLLVPFKDPERLRGEFSLLLDLVRPRAAPGSWLLFFVINHK